jgi:hypothetical protein
MPMSRVGARACPCNVVIFSPVRQRERRVPFSRVLSEYLIAHFSMLGLAFDRVESSFYTHASKPVEPANVITLCAQVLGAAAEGDL